MIKSFKDRDTENIFKGNRVKKYSLGVQEIARRKLRHIEAAYNLNDLKIPPGNKLEKLSGDRTGQYSIRINKQWRVCFKWENNEAFNVEITDYH